MINFSIFDKRLTLKDILTEALKTSSPTALPDTLFNDELTDDEKRRQFSRLHNYVIKPGLYDRWGPRLQPSLCLLALISPIYCEVFNYALRSGLLGNEFLGFLKQLSSLIKIYNTALQFEHWDLLIDIHTIFPYLPDFWTSDEKISQAREWTNSATDRTGQLNWVTAFSQSVAELVDTLDASKMAEELKLADFMLRGDIWGGSGASSQKQTVIEPKLQKTKWNTYFYGSVEGGINECRLSVKREFGVKLRAIIGSSDYDHVLQSHFVEQIERAAAGTTWSTLHMTQKQKLRLWKDLMTHTGFFLPLDQSAFDHNVAAWEIEVVVRAWAHWLSFHAHNEEAASAVKWCNGFRSGHITVEGEVIPYVDGVMSGWRMTALIDTWVNAAYVLTVRRLLSAEIGYFDMWFNAQGDDDIICFKTLKPVLLFPMVYEYYGFKVNASKSGYSPVRKHLTPWTEYLRYGTTKSESKGYPARLIHSLLWRNPKSVDFASRSAILLERAILWEKFAQRLSHLPNVRKVLKRFVIIDMTPTDDERQWLTTPSNMGGAMAFRKWTTWFGSNKAYFTALDVQINSWVPPESKTINELCLKLPPIGVSNWVGPMIKTVDRVITLGNSRFVPATRVDVTFSVVPSMVLPKGGATPFWNLRLEEAMRRGLMSQFVECDNAPLIDYFSKCSSKARWLILRKGSAPTMDFDVRVDFASIMVRLRVPNLHKVTAAAVIAVQAQENTFAANELKRELGGMRLLA